jgi:hypothetical protein
MFSGVRHVLKLEVCILWRVWNKTNWSTGASSLSDKILVVCAWNLFGFIVLGPVFIFKFPRCSVMTVQVVKFPSPSLLHISSEGQGYKELGSETDSGFVLHFLHALLPYRVTQSQWPWRNHDPWLTKFHFLLLNRAFALSKIPCVKVKKLELLQQHIFLQTTICKLTGVQNAYVTRSLSLLSLVLIRLEYKYLPRACYIDLRFHSFQICIHTSIYRGNLAVLQIRYCM